MYQRTKIVVFFFVVHVFGLQSIKAQRSPAIYWDLLWEDHFDSQYGYDEQLATLPNSDDWNVETRRGWGKRLQTYTNDLENVMVKDGHLVITAINNGSNAWTSGSITTLNKHDIKYGKIEVRAKLPEGNGTWPAIWCMPTDNKYGGWPNSGEIDIMEHIGVEREKIRAAVHMKNYNHKLKNGFKNHTIIEDYHEKFHTYTLEWTPKQIFVYVDGIHYFSFPENSIDFNYRDKADWPFDQKFYLILNLAMGDWGGDPSALDTARMYVDWVKMYSMDVCKYKKTQKVSNRKKTHSFGDQGDGTFVNPILNSDYPDSDVVKHGEKYYMISSKKHMSPGMIILESYDMVNWKIINHVYDKITWGSEYNWDKMAGYGYGVWAGDLAYHSGTWYCYVIDPHHGLLVSTTKDIYGKWSTPKLMLGAEKVFDDPGVFWDDENKEAYLIANAGWSPKEKVRRKNIFDNKIFKMSWDGTEILDEGKLFYTGVGAEAAKIYKIDEKWFIFISEWDTISGGKRIDRKQIALRSKSNSIYGPYDKKVLLEKGNGFKRSTSQGALVQGPDSSWWYYHQLIQNITDPFQGRPQCLQPVEWINGWPIIGKDIDNDGIGEPLRTLNKPNIKTTKKLEIQTDDEFLNSKLGHQWEWNHNPRDTHWSLTDRKGWLRLKASKLVPKTDYELHDGTPFWRSCNTLSQRIMGTVGSTGIAKFDLSGMAKGQRAGFVRFGGVSHIIGIHKDAQGNSRVFFMDNMGNETIGPLLKANVIYFKSRNIGKLATFQYSYDNKTFKDFGSEFTLRFGRWTGDRLGFFCWNDLDDAGYVDVDWFHYDYE
jgi:beta-xylosidase